MKFLINSQAEMNFNYLHIDDKSLSYNDLLTKVVLAEDDYSEDFKSRDRSNTVARTKKVNIPSRSEQEHDRDHYYNVNY